FHSVIRALIPSLGVTELERAVVNIYNISAVIERQTSDVISAIQEEIRDLSCVVLQNRMAPNFLLAAQGGMCAVINTSCCSYVDQSGRNKKDLV
ncbi:ERVV2 protein, partial [Machaerirhynchus nigripectus]|nr:ERVV2 protein [Machaerirhynchus nigripectus]